MCSFKKKKKNLFGVSTKKPECYVGFEPRPVLACLMKGRRQVRIWTRALSRIPSMRHTVWVRATPFRSSDTRLTTRPLWCKKMEVWFSKMVTFQQFCGHGLRSEATRQTVNTRKMATRKSIYRRCKKISFLIQSTNIMKLKKQSKQQLNSL